MKESSRASRPTRIAEERAALVGQWLLLVHAGILLVVVIYLVDQSLIRPLVPRDLTLALIPVGFFLDNLARHWVRPGWPRTSLRVAAAAFWGAGILSLAWLLFG